MKYTLEHCSCGLIVESDDYREINNYLHDNFGNQLLEMNNIYETENYVIMYYIGGYTLKIKK